MASGGRPEPRDRQASAEDVSGDEPERRPKTVERLLARREQHQQRGRLYRGGWVLAGGLLIVAGIVLSGPGIPGPGFLVILLGLAMLALEFVWAERLLERALVYGNRAKEQASGLSAAKKASVGAAIIVAVTAMVIAVVVWDIPYLPDK